MEGLSLCVRSCISLKDSIFQYNKLLGYVCRVFGALYTLTVHYKTASELADLQPNKHTHGLG